MLMKFRENQEPCVVYNVLSGPDTDYDEVLQKYCACFELEVLGPVAAELLEEATDHPENIPAIDVAIYLTNNT
jgi:hypothetical protein